MGSYISGLFWVSRIAAIGIPKLDAGPQKSACVCHGSLPSIIGHST